MRGFVGGGCGGELNVPPPPLSAKIFANGAQRLVKAPFLDFSWSRNAKMV